MKITFKEVIETILALILLLPMPIILFMPGIISNLLK